MINQAMLHHRAIKAAQQASDAVTDRWDPEVTPEERKQRALDAADQAYRKAWDETP